MIILLDVLEQFFFSNFHRDRDIDLASLKSSESSSSPRSKTGERMKGENVKHGKPEDRLKGPLRAAYEGKLNLLVGSIEMPTERVMNINMYQCKGLEFGPFGHGISNLDKFYQFMT